MKEITLKKVVEWDETKINGKHIKDNQLLFIGFVSMIPIIGQIWWIHLLISSLLARKVKYVVIKEVKK